MADDHELFRDGFAGMIAKSPEIELLDMAPNGQFLLALVDKYRPDVVLTDIQMAPVGGVEVTLAITKRYPGIAVIALSMYEDGIHIIEMIKAGACGYVTKNAKREAVAEAIKAASRGENYYCKTASSQISALIAAGQYDPVRDTKNLFTPMDIRIIQLICEDLESKQIAEILHLSPLTVKRHRIKILDKAGVNSTVALVVYAVRNGLVR